MRAAVVKKKKNDSHLIQFSGSPSQSVLHRNRSQDSQPIGGVRANPFSNPFIWLCVIKTIIMHIVGSSSIRWGGVFEKVIIFLKCRMKRKFNLNALKLTL